MLLAKDIKENSLKVNGDRIFCTSLDVAERFSKRHDDVLKAIKSSGCTEDFRARNFEPSEYEAYIGYSNAKRKYPCYLMTRDGFVFLVMGFTGREATRFKEAYIRAFNMMEAPAAIVAFELLNRGNAQAFSLANIASHSSMLTNIR